MRSNSTMPSLPFCQQCGNPLPHKPWRTRKAVCCSLDCLLVCDPAVSNRFWSHADKTSGCWIWTGACIANGYGEVGIGGHQYRVPRIAYRIAHGSIDDSLQVCHTCDNPACYNPDHLFQGTALENMADRGRKGRVKRNGKLHPDLVRSIRHLYATSHQTQSSIAQQFGIKQNTVSQIVNGSRWKYIE